jgi:nucleoside-diphosphate-sugar epimerase
VGDVNSIAGIKQLDIDFDWVIHLAAQVSVVEGELNPKADFNSNALGTFEVVQWAKNAMQRSFILLQTRYLVILLGIQFLQLIPHHYCL